MQGRNRDTDIENGHVDTAGEGEGGMNWETSIDIYTHKHTYIHTHTQRLRCLDSPMDSVESDLSKLRHVVKGRNAWRAAVHGFEKS